MNWNEFKSNVEQWAQERGIYDHSTPEAQLLKALSELGELADAVVKNDREALCDAIGDVAVCIVNYAGLAGQELSRPAFAPLEESNVEALVGELAHAIGTALMGETESSFETEFMPCLLVGIAQCFDGVVFADCCAQAWHEIKDRKGCMIPGGAFVKEGEG